MSQAQTISVVTDFGARLREARERLGLTQEEVAQRSGVHATEVSRMEAGKRDPKISTLRRLAKASRSSLANCSISGRKSPSVCSRCVGPRDITKHIPSNGQSSAQVVKLTERAAKLSSFQEVATSYSK